MRKDEKKVIRYLKNYCNTDLLYEQKHYDYIKFLIKSFEKQQIEINENYHEGYIDGRISMNYEIQDKIKAKIKELVEQKEKLKYDGNRSFADYEQFCKNLKFFKEQIEELLEEK